MELFWENNYRLKAVKYFRKKASNLRMLKIAMTIVFQAYSLKYSNKAFLVRNFFLFVFHSLHFGKF